MTNPTSIDKTKDHETDLEGQEKPLSNEEKLEAGLEESMDASDPPAATAPGDHGDPVPSSGFTKEMEDDNKRK
ncbi:hypothetical protein LWE61_18835 [Sphingobium sufflavum]|uniref:hypothetical protein n=1 Tax=Sphingobium sufflavum TaxID=1129547 RepID=UPI001F425333|nr:hypothetical protein [Sphingobium sufflavum]MCE7798591.1 hypothetical protein [Sphingobium sufflavum]